jgi:hypothetical protein
VTGFIKGLFRSKPKAEAADSEPAPKPQPAPKPSAAPKSPRSRAEAYYLSADDAKTYGDIEFMRSAKSIRRTFPKTKDGKTPERIEKISSLEKAAEQGLIPTALNTTTSQSSIEDTLKVAERRKADTSMDMFRNMARDIRKQK